MYKWCKILEEVVMVKEVYKLHKGNYGNYKFDTWLEHLKSYDTYNIKELVKVFEPLQTNQEGDLLLIRFGLTEMQQMGDMWSNKDSVYRDCRSIVLDIKEEKVIQAPFRKFFNLNEIEENSIENVLREIGNADIVEITNKLDGSMQCATMYNGEILLTGSRAISPKNSYRLQEGYSMLTANHKNMIATFPFITFIFEYISLKDPHVVVYTKEQQGLYLIGARDKFTGREYSYSELKRFSRVFEVPMTEVESITFEEAVNQVDKFTSDQKEGWVLYIDGHRIKLKCDDYVNVHRALDKMGSSNVVIRAIADNTYDDLFAKIPKGYKSRVKAIADKIFEHITKTHFETLHWYEPIRDHKDKKEAMIWITKHVPKDVQGYVKNMYNGRKNNYLKKGFKLKKMKDMGFEEGISNIFERK